MHQPGTSHRRLPRLAVLVLVPVLVCAISLSACQGTPSRQVDAAGSGPASPMSTVSTQTYGTPVAKQVGVPVTVEIPAIGVAAEVVEVGLEADGAMDVPDFGLAGWYGLGPRPGEPGAAVVVAHVDSRTGPDVFFRLRELRASDRITIRADDGLAHSFVVERLEPAPKDQLPVDRIWGDTDQPVLRLITCGGSFDRSTGHYRDNVIIYATAI